MNNDETILDPMLRRSERSEREYLYKVLERAEYKGIISTTDPSHIYTWSGWPLEADFFRDKKQE
jgi:hypothetical protein